MIDKLPQTFVFHFKDQSTTLWQMTLNNGVYWEHWEPLIGLGAYSLGAHQPAGQEQHDLGGLVQRSQNTAMASADTIDNSLRVRNTAGFSRLFMVIHGYSWLLMVIHVYGWLLLVIDGC